MATPLDPATYQYTLISQSSGVLVGEPFVTRLDANGDLVGWSGLYGGNYHNSARGFEYTNGSLTFAEPLDATSFEVNGISANGILVGVYTTGGFYPSSPVSHSFMDVNGVFTTIDVPNAVDTDTVGVNDAGVVVGYGNTIQDGTATGSPHVW